MAGDVKKKADPADSLGQFRRFGIGVFLGIALGACDSSEKAPLDTGAAPTIAEIAQTQPISISLNQVSDVYALGSKATDLQREMMRKELMGSVVSWKIKVYEIESAEGGRFKVISEPPLANGNEGLSLLHVQAIVTPRSDTDRQLIAATKTGDNLVIKGRIQDIVLRGAVVIHPAMVDATK